jgi:HPt (histidine-containing phosphotransfer) domain-containing protein
MKYIDLNYIKQTIGNNEEIIKQLIKLGILQFPTIIEELINAYKIKDYRNLKQNFHKFKGSFQIVGSFELADRLKILEIECDERTMSEIEFSEFFERTIYLAHCCFSEMNELIQGEK